MSLKLAAFMSDPSYQKGLEALVQGGCKAFAEGARSSAQPTEARP